MSLIEKMVEYSTYTENVLEKGIVIEKYRGLTFERIELPSGTGLRTEVLHYFPVDFYIIRKPDGKIVHVEAKKIKLVL